MRGLSRIPFALVALALWTMPAAAFPVRLKGELVSNTRGTTRVILVGHAFAPLSPFDYTAAIGVARCRPLTGRCFAPRGRFELTVTGDQLRGALTFGAVGCSLSGQVNHLGCRSPCVGSFQGTYTCMREDRDVDQGTLVLRPLPARIFAQ